MRKLMLLIAAGALWLFLAAIPAFADGGPHIAAVNSGTNTLTTDSCAGCHRAHTGKGQYLLAYPGEVDDFCLGCHGTAGTGASVDVETGIQYALASGVRDEGTTIGATRAGGFTQARIGDPARGMATTSRGAAYLTKVTVGAAANVNSAHLVGGTLNSLSGTTHPAIAWGNGANGSGAGAALTMECTSCHNPHGNNQYRILNPVPDAGSITAFQSYAIQAIDGNTDTVTFKTAHEFQPGDKISISANLGGLTTAGNPYTVVNVPNGVSIQVGTFVAGGFNVVDLSASGATGTISRYQAVVTDAPLFTANNPTTGSGASLAYPERNYTVMQVMGTQGTDTSYMLYAQNVLDARGGTGGWAAGNYTATGGDYWHRQVPWYVATAASAKNISAVASNVFTTTAAHGFVVGDQITFSNLPPTAGTAATNGVFVIASVPTTTTFTVNAGSWADGTWAANRPSATKVTAQDDAPNGNPTTNPAGDVGAVAFNVQITAWCTSCHTRYYANQNPNPGGNTVSSSGTYAAKTVSTTVAVANNVVATTATHGLVIGDTVQFTGLAGITGISNATSYTVATVPTGYTFTLVGVTASGTATAGTVSRTTEALASSSWDFPRQDATGAVDSTFTYQHRTIPNRACTTCHVAHGSDRVMSGPFSSQFTLPNGTASDSSRLLKIDNRGTCQGCHDPTSTWATTYTNGWEGSTNAYTPAGPTYAGTNPVIYNGGTPVLP